MIVLNEVIRDGRVLRAAEALRDWYDLTVLGVDRGHFDFDPAEQRCRLGLNLEWVPLRWSGRLARNQAGYAARYLEAFVGLLRRCRQLRPTVIHAHDNTALPVAMAARAAVRCKVVYDAHELYRDQVSTQPLSWARPIHLIETWAMRHCAGIIACNKYRAAIMRREYGAPFTPTVIRNVPPFHPYRPSSLLVDYARRQNRAVRRIVLYQGGVGQGRSLDLLVRALPLLAADVAVVLIGPGKEEYKQQLTALAAELGVPDRLFIHPPVDHTDLPEYTCSAHVGVVIYRNISRNHYYCAPNKLYEYAAAGLPAAGADLPPIRDFLEEFGTGETFDPWSAESLAQTIQRLLSDPQDFERYRRNSLAAARIMCWQNESKRLVDLYDRILTDSTVR